MQRNFYFFFSISIGLVALTFALQQLAKPASVSPEVHAQTPNQDWPQLQRDSQKSGFQSSMRVRTSSSFSSPLWSWNAPETIVSQPIVASGIVVAVGMSGKVYAIDELTGKERWTVQVGARSLSTPAIVQDILVVPTTAGKMVGLRTRDGSRVWEYARGGRGFVASPTIQDTTIFIGSQDGVFHAVNAINGSALWTYRVGRDEDSSNHPAPILTSAAVLGSTVYFGSENMVVYALNVANGTSVWKRQLTGQSFFSGIPIGSSTGTSFFLTGWFVASSQGNGTLFVRTNSTYPFHDLLNEDQDFLATYLNSNGIQATYTSSGNLREWTIEQRGIAERLQSNPHRRTLWELNTATGKDRYSLPLPILYTSGVGSIPAAPVVDDAQGRAWVMARSIYARWDGVGVRNFGDMVKLNLRYDPAVYQNVALGLSALGMQFFPCSNTTCTAPNQHWHKISDEGEVLTGAENVIVSDTWVAQGGYDLETEKSFPIRLGSSDDSGNAALYLSGNGVVFANGRILSRDTLGIKSYSAQ